MNEDGHDVLVVEDDPATAKRIGEVVRSRGDRPRVVATVEDALAELRKPPPCYLIVDQQLPATAGEPAIIGGGPRVMEAARKINARRNADGWREMPLIVLTGYTSHHDFVSDMFDRGADAFVEKPLGDKQIESLLAKIALVMGRAQRESHAACAAFATSTSTPTSTSTSTSVTLFLEGTKDGARTTVVINSARRAVQDAVFLMLLRLVVAHQRSARAFSSRDALGMAARNATSRVREAFDGLVPASFEILQGDNGGAFRLNPDIVIEGVDWAALEEHPHAGVQKIAREQRTKAK